MAACASGPRYAELKSSIPSLAPGKGRIYFYRTTTLGAALQPNIVLNGEVVGVSKAHGFFYVDRAPGSYEAASSTEVTRKVSFVLAAGQERYIKTSISMGFMAGHAIPELVEPEVGAKEIVTTHYTPTDQSKAQQNAK